MANPLALPMREAVDIMARLFLQDDHTDAPTTFEATKVGVKTSGIHVDTVGTSSAPPPVQSFPPRPRGMPSGIMMISQDTWTKAMTHLVTLTVKVSHIEGRVKTWMDWKLEAQDR